MEHNAPKTSALSGGLRIIRHGVSWGAYERVIVRNASNSVCRLVYDRGTLEMARPTDSQQAANRVLAAIVSTTAHALRIQLRAVGETNYRRPDLLRGFGSDVSFYIQNASRIQPKRGIELPSNPPPDLVIDFAAAGASLDLLPIYADFGVPEIWRYEEMRDRVVVLRLRQGKYREKRESAALVPLTSDLLTIFVRKSCAEPQGVWQDELESWLRTYD